MGTALSSLREPVSSPTPESLFGRSRSAKKFFKRLIALFFVFKIRVIVSVNFLQMKDWILQFYLNQGSISVSKRSDYEISGTLSVAT